MYGVSNVVDTGARMEAVKTNEHAPKIIPVHAHPKNPTQKKSRKLLIFQWTEQSSSKGKK
jgi:hypothetical protein